jgi:hypothetical protein
MEEMFLLLQLNRHFRQAGGQGAFRRFLPCIGPLEMDDEANGRKVKPLLRW